MSYTIKTTTQYAVINNDTGKPIAVCQDLSEAVAIATMMNTEVRPPAKAYTFMDWAKWH